MENVNREVKTLQKEYSDWYSLCIMYIYIYEEVISVCLF